MKVIRIILILIAGAVLLIVLMGLFAKKSYHIERSIDIKAPHAMVYDQVRYFKNFAKWSPWQDYDPNMKVSITGPDGEPGAMYSWEGNDDVGKGTQTLRKVLPERIDIDLKFLEPWETSSPVFINLDDKGDATTVTWGFDMHIGFPWNGMAMLTDVNAAVGKDYERGLANLKKITEAIANKDYRGYKIKEADLPRKYYVGTRKTLSFAEIGRFYGTNLPKIMQDVRKNELEMAGMPSGLFWSYDEKAGKTDMAAALPVATEPKVKGWSVFPVGGRKALVIEYHGPYEKTGEAHMASDDYMKERHYTNVPPVVEEYVTDPMTEPDTMKWLTRIIYFVEPSASQN